MIQNLIFDVGNVLLEYRWFDMLTVDYGMSAEEANRIGNELFENELWAATWTAARLLWTKQF